jgi:hypothetical protein
MHAAALAALSLALAPANAAAAGRVTWTGKDPDGCRYTFYRTFGDSWTGKIKDQGGTDTGDYTEVMRTGEYVELELTGSNGAERARLYDNKLYFYSRDGAGRWIKMAEGKWTR